MRYKTLIFVLLISINFSYSQQKKTIKDEEIKQQKILDKINLILSKEVDSINFKFSHSTLRDKFNSSLNSIASIKKFYTFGYDLLEQNESIELIDRIEYIANEFYKNESYILFNFYYGYGFRISITEQIINKFKVKSLTYGGGCQITKFDKREKVILQTFNNKMKELLSKS